MPDVIKAALTTSLVSEEGLPVDLQYMPPGKHRLNASRNGKPVTEKTFRRFSPTFVPDEAGHVVGSETNMGGLVNRAAFKSIQPLFAKDKQNSSLESQVSALIEARLDRTPRSRASQLDGRIPRGFGTCPARSRLAWSLPDLG